jgi:hypothetical protein
MMVAWLNFDKAAGIEQPVRPGEQQTAVFAQKCGFGVLQLECGKLLKEQT